MIDNDFQDLGRTPDRAAGRAALAVATTISHYDAALTCVYVALADCAGACGGCRANKRG